MLPADNRTIQKRFLINILKVIYLVTVFAVACLCFSYFLNQGNADLTSDMKLPTLPVVHTVKGENDVNYMYGYLNEMDTRFMRDNLTVVGNDRKLDFVVDTFGATVRSIYFEIRSIDGTRLVEKTDVSYASTSDDELKCSLTAKDLITPEVEYMLVIVLSTKEHNEIRYYTRFLESEELHVDEKIDYICDFSSKTFNKEQAKELTKYLESDSSGDNSGFMYADIHSSFKQVTWGDLNISRIGRPRVTISEITPATGYFRLDYQVSITREQGRSLCDVSEYFRIRYTSERMYLLSWERRLEEIPEAEDLVIAQNRINMGFADPGMELVESDGGNEFAFVSARKLIGVSIPNHKVSSIYSFYDEDNDDLRCSHRDHKIRILSVDETGDVEFMVYGYMNRGMHEGHVGICVYEYNSAYNTIEEIAYINYLKSAAILMDNVDELSFADREGHEYYMLERGIYKIDPEKKSVTSIADSLSDDSYKISDNGQLLQWQIEGGLYNSEKLRLLNLATGISEDIKAGYAEYIYPIGFMGTDCVYGLAKSRDVRVDIDGSMIFPMSEIVIRDVSGEILKTYARDGVYIMDYEMADGCLTLHRATIDDKTGELTPIEDDQIVRVQEIAGQDNQVTTAATDTYGTVVSVTMKEEMSGEEVIFLKPRETVREDMKDMTPQTNVPYTGYYVYGLHGYIAEYMETANALNRAYDEAGIVIDSEGKYIWYKTNRSGKNQIMAIGEPDKKDASDSLAECIDTMLEYEGVTTNSEILLGQGTNAMQILETYLTDMTVLNLTGCSLDAVLYYVNMDIPVLAILNDSRSFLITGFNESQIVLYDPTEGELHKENITDMDNLFRSSGYRFITYVRH